MVEQKLKELNIELDQKLKERTKELKESEERLRTFMESATDGFVLFDPELNYIDVNNVTLQILGMNKEDLIGKNILDMSPDLKETNRYDKYLDVLKTGKPFNTEDVIYNRFDGNMRFYYSVRAFKVGENLGIIFTDITGRKKTEKLSRLHSKIMNYMSEGLYLVRSIDGIIVYTNPRFEEMFGYNPGEMLGKHVSIINAPIDKNPEVTAKEIMGILEETGQWHGEIQNIKKDGTPFWCYANVSTFDHPEYGTVIVSIHTDITERKKVEAKLITSEYNLRERVKKLSFLYELSQLVENPDISLEEIIQGTLDLIPHAWQLPEKINVTIKYDNRIFQTDNFIETKWKLTTNLRINEKLLLIEVYYLEDKPFLQEEKFLINEIGNRLKIFIEQKKAEEIIKEEIENLKKLDKTKSNFINRVSHELKTPLLHVFSTSNFLLKEYKDQMNDNVKELVEIMNKGGLRMKKLIENMLDASKIEANMLELKYSEENLTEIINECVNEISYFLKKRHLILDIDLPVNLPFEVDRVRIKQVFTNILTNAIKNTPPKGKIFIYLKQENSYFDINIRDTGIGLTEEEKLQIFKKFGKIERYEKKMDVDIEGSGLGLYISKEIVYLHGGEIYVISEGRNKGATIKVRLHNKKQDN